MQDAASPANDPSLDISARVTRQVARHAGMPGPAAHRVAALFDQRMARLRRWAGRVQLGGFLCAWVIATLVAFLVSPSPRAYVVAGLGVVLSGFPMLLLRKRSGWWLTRHTAGALQMLWTTVLAYAFHGHFEVEIHVLGALAVLACYRDWRLILSATGFALISLAIRLAWPAASEGVLDHDGWHLLQSAGWLAIADAILILVCLRGVNEARITSTREAALEEATELFEQHVIARTAELAGSREQFRALVETVSAVPWETNGGSSSLSYVGPQVERLFGHPRHHWYQDRFLERCIPADQRAGVLAALEECAKTGVGAEIEHRLVTQGGETREIRNVVSVAASVAGPRLRGLIFDVTEMKRLETELHQAQKLESVGRLAAGVAHEINTPVQFVTDNVNFLKTGVADLETLIDKYRAAHDQMATGALSAHDASRLLAEAETDADLSYLREHIHKAATSSLDGLARVAEIVRSMKAFAHPEQKQMTPLDLNQALAGTLVMAKNEYKYVADVETELGDVPPVVCQAGEINQVFLNILVNASHAIGDVVGDSGLRGCITVRTKQVGPDVSVTISDTGAGIPAAIRDKIFDQFFTTKPLGKGTGQGLAIARGMVARHGGSLTFQSEEGHGTTFEIRLPIAGPPAAAAAPAG